MRFTQCLIPTLKESPQDAERKSHKLMIRAGLIRKLASGTYSYLPLGLRVLQKIEAIIREEMNAAGGLEVLLPALHPAELWKETGRFSILGEDMFHIKDRHGKENVLGPTHEEVITDLVRKEVRSYKQLPLILYQIQTKFRDEARPRSGVIRSREFIMKDAYSFHADAASLDATYERMKQAYCRIFERCGLKYHIVKADPGAMGGSGSQEFVLFSEAGEDRMVQIGGEVKSAEMAERAWKAGPADHPKTGKHKKEHTPGRSSVESVAAFFKKQPTDLLKTMIYETLDPTSGAGSKVFAVLVRGDHEVSDYKVRKNARGAGSALATRETIQKLGSSFGFSGPIGLNVPLLIDADVMQMKDFIIGANEKDYHYAGVNVGDFLEGRAAGNFEVGDFRLVMDGDKAPDGGEIKIQTAIELGHIFKLNLRYSEPMKANILDENGKEKPMVMGCYGIGVNRIVASAIEQAATDKGIIWPSQAISPFQIQILPLNMDEAEIRDAAEGYYKALTAKGYEILIDDRYATSGVKFNDADLLGIPVQIIVGAKNLKNGQVEVRNKATGETKLVSRENAVEEAEKLLDKSR